MKTALKLLIGASTLASGAAFAQSPPESINADADTFVRQNDSGNYGGYNYLNAKRNGNNGTRAALIRFDRGATGFAENAALHLAVSSFGSSSCQYRVWGIADGDAAEAFVEHGVHYTTYSGLFSGKAVNSGSSRIHDSDPNTAGRQPLGDFWVFPGDENAHFSTPELAQFITDSNDGELTFVIERLTEGGAFTTFASKENTTLDGPNLEINIPPAVYLETVGNVKHSWKASNTPADVLSDGIIFTQAVTVNGSDPGYARINSDGDVFFQENDNGSHWSGENVDIVAFVADLGEHIPTETGTFTMGLSNNTQTDTVEAVADTHVQINSTSAQGSSGEILVKYSGGSNGLTRKGMVRFERPLSDDVSAATLRLNVSRFDNGAGVSSATFSIWGVADRSDGEEFEAETALHDDFPDLFDTSNDGLVEAGVYGGAKLGQITVEPADLNGEVTFTSQALIDFLNDDVDGDITFVITRDLNAYNVNSGFASSENSTLDGPMLDITYRPSNLHVVEFNQTYERPVFFAQSRTYAGSDPIAVYPTMVGEDFAVVRMAEGPSYDNDWHATETINWAVFEAGFYNLGHNGFLDVGMTPVTTSDYSPSGLTSITPRGGTFDSSAGIIAQPQLSMLDGYVGARVKKVVNNGVITAFEVGHMLDKPRQQNGSIPATTGFMGWMILGKATPHGTPDDLATWSEDEGDFLSVGSQGGGASSGGGCGTSTTTSSAYYSAEDDFGDDTAGADYLFRAGVTDTLESYDLWAGVEGSVGATLFEKELSILDVGAVATAENNQQATNLFVYILGSAIYDEEISAVADFGESKTFFTVSATYFGVTLSGSLDGEAGVSVTGAPGATGISFEAGPYMGVVGDASVSVGCCGFSASVSGEIDIMVASLPTEVDLTFGSSSANWDAETNLELSALDGSIKLKLKALFWKKTKTILSWDGWSETIEILEPTSGCLSW